jgi:hypothetical protein
MTLSGLLQRRNGAAAAGHADPVPVDDDETTGATALVTDLPAAVAAAPPAQHGLIRATSFPSSATTSDSPLTIQNPIVRTDAGVTSEYPAMTAWATSPYRPSATKRRAPAAPPRPRAPIALKVGVGILAIAAAGAVDIAVTKPVWLPKNEVHVAPTPKTSAKAKPAVVATMTLRSSTPAQAVYALPPGPFNLAVSISHPCWVMVKSLPSGKTLFTQTLEPGTSVPPTTVRGSASITVAARANAIVLTEGGKTVGTITAPIVGHTYVLVGSPASSTK